MKKCKSIYCQGWKSRRGGRVLLKTKQTKLGVKEENACENEMREALSYSSPVMVQQLQFVLLAVVTETGTHSLPYGPPRDGGAGTKTYRRDEEEEAQGMRREEIGRVRVSVIGGR